MKERAKVGGIDVHKAFLQVCIPRDPENTLTGILAPVALARKILSILWHLLVNR